MIVYFADRQLNIIGQASTNLPNGLVISDDKKTEEVETGVNIFECRIAYDKATQGEVKACTEVGNYILRNNGKENELYTVIDVEIDTKKQTVYIYAEDDGMDLLNDVVGAYEADQAYPITHYINKYAAAAGFTVGINEASSLTRKLSWDGESTASARIASVATQFDGCEVSYSFEVDGLYVVKKHINIHKERGEDNGVQLRLNRDIDSIITTKSIGNIATALQCVGGTIDQSSTVLEATSGGNTKVAYKVDLETASRTANTAEITATISASLTDEKAELGEDRGLVASIYMGGSWHSATIKATDGDNKQKWSGKVSHTTEYTFTVSGVPAGVTTYTDIKFKVEKNGGNSSSDGALASTNCGKFIVPNYIVDGENGEDINNRPITLEGYEYDDGDFYVDGNVLKSRNALQKWARAVWRTEESQKSGGHIYRPYSYDTYNQKTLCEKAITELKKLREMEVNYEIDIKELPHNVKIGDRINIVDGLGELYVSARVLKLESSVTNAEYTVTLGEYLIKSSGIHQKVKELAAQFAQSTVSVKRALSIANNAKNAASEAQTQANAAAAESEKVLVAVDGATNAANAATQSAQAAQEAASNAQAAVDTVEESVAGLQNTVANAQAAAEQAQQAAETAQTKANEARQAVVNAQAKADEAATAAGNAQAKADSAESKADTAQSAAEQAIADATAAATTAAAAKQDAENAQKDIDAFGENLTTLENTMTADYARKTDLTESEAKLQTQITQNANEISSTASKVQKIDETANNAAEQAQAAQTAAGAAQEQADQAAVDAQAAQTAADNAAAAAQAAQGEADTAKAAADTAKSVADKAEADLAEAKADLATVTSRVDSTEEEIAAAQQAVEAAQTAANNAKADANAAAKKAAEAQGTANTAVTNAANAQSAADDAASKANLAQQAADAAKGDAAAAQAKADEAAEAAATAQETANTAKTNAENAQQAANQAAANAAAAQRAADDADAKAAQAAKDLAAAQQNLADVTSRVGATEEEVAAAQQAVQTAQQAADKAKQDAQTAQSTADTAKANAATAQTAANNAKAAADKAQADATAAQKAADDAQADVDALAVRVTTAETKITQNSEQIALRATKKEVAQTLGNYYTIDQTDAAITTKANEINLSVDSKIEGVQVGGRNIALGTGTPITITGTGVLNQCQDIYLTSVNFIDLANEEVAVSFDYEYSEDTDVDSLARANIRPPAEPFTIIANFLPTESLSGHYSGVAKIYTSQTSVSKISTRFDYFTGSVTISNLKIERGNKATDWTPAPEDIDSKFSNYSTTEEMNAAIDLKAEGIFSSVKSTYTTKEDFASLDVGGRNFVRDSSLKEKTNLWVFDTNNTYSFLNGYCEVYRDTTIASRTFNSQSTNNNKLLKPDGLSGGTFTLSAEIKLLDGYSITDNSTLFYRCNATELSSGFQEISVKLGGATTEWKKVYSTFTFGEYNFDGSCQVCIALANIPNAGTGICIRNIKLERGNKVTDWTPAPEDVESDVTDAQNAADEAKNTANNNATSIATAETTIQQLADSIAALVRDGNGGSLIQQDSSGLWYFNIGGLEKSVSDTANSLTGLEGIVLDANGEIDVLKSTAAALASRTEYVRSYTDENGQPCLELGEGDSVFKVRITNTEIQFAEGTTVPARINRKMLVIEKAMVKQELQFGDDAVASGVWIWKRRDNGNLGLSWKEVAN